MSSKSKGILFIILAALSFALMNTCVRLAGDINTFEKAFFRNFVAALITGVIMLRQHVPTKLSRESRRLVLGRVVLGTLGLVCNFYAVSRINLADANMLNKMSPFFAVVFSALLLKEKMSLRQLLIVLGAFAASLLIIKPSPANLQLVPSLVGALAESPPAGPTPASGVPQPMARPAPWWYFASLLFPPWPCCPWPC